MTKAHAAASSPNTAPTAALSGRFMPTNMTEIREHLARALAWDEARATFDKAVAGIPAGKRGARADGFEHSPWQLIEHIRIAQDDILDFCVNAKYEHTMKWPDDYWPAKPEPANA